MTFEQAKILSQGEILAVFGIQKDAMAESENLDISQAADDTI
jgi:hypothetical protein